MSDLETGLGSRRRILSAMVELVGEYGFEGVAIAELCARAHVSTRTFYEHFNSSRACFLATLDEGLEQACELVEDAAAIANGEECEGDDLHTLRRVRQALLALLSFLDRRPDLARVWLVESVSAGTWALEHRERNVSALARHVIVSCRVRSHVVPDSGRLPAGAAMASVLGVLQRQVISDAPEPLVDLVEPLMSLALAPYLELASQITGRYPAQQLPEQAVRCITGEAAVSRKPRVAQRHENIAPPQPQCATRARRRPLPRTEPRSEQPRRSGGTPNHQPFADVHAAWPSGADRHSA
jgi:AcrR family transcriptional regulator